MKHQSGFSEEHQQSQQAGAQQQAQQGAAREFATAEEALRYDAAHTTVPPEIARRLQRSTRDLPQPKTAWWKRWLRGGKL